MKKELEEKLFKSFPLLYGDRDKDMTRTCMCWGIDCGDGWYNIIYDLSSKLETIIMYIREKNKDKDCHNCGCKYNYHDIESKKKSCSAIHKLPFEIKMIWGHSVPSFNRNIKNYGYINGLKKYIKEQYKYIVWYAKYKINKILYKLYKYGLHHKVKCYCPNYEIPYPRASQVKEKYGTLRFYMTYETDKIREYISEAERLSGFTCEKCGKPGKIRSGGWIRTLCDWCNTNRKYGE